MMSSWGTIISKVELVEKMISLIKVEFMAELLYWIASDYSVYLMKWPMSGQTSWVGPLHLILSVSVGQEVPRTRQVEIKIGANNTAKKSTAWRSSHTQNQHQTQTTTAHFKAHVSTITAQHSHFIWDWDVNSIFLVHMIHTFGFISNKTHARLI